MRSREEKITLFVNIVVPIAVVLFIILFLPKLIHYFFPFVISFCVAFILNPLILLFGRKFKMKRKISALILTLILFALLILVIFVLISAVASLITTIVNKIPGVYEDFLFALDTLEKNNQVLFSYLPANVIEFIHSFSTNMDQIISEAISKLAKPTLTFSLNAVKSVPGLLIQIIVFVLSSIWMTMDYASIMAKIIQITPNPVKDFVKYLKEDLKKIFSTWFIAQLKIMFVVFAVLVVSFYLIKVKSGLLIAFITAFLDMLPAFGVGFIMWPWTAYEFIVGNYLLGAELVIIYLLTQFVRNTLQPKIMGDSMGLPPLLTLVFMFIGFRVWSIAGMIFAVPIGMLIISTVRYGVFDNFVYSVKTVAGDIGVLLKKR